MTAAMTALAQRLRELCARYEKSQGHLWEESSFDLAADAAAIGRELGRAEALKEAAQLVADECCEGADAGSCGHRIVEAIRRLSTQPAPGAEGA